jgi:SAM-dependent methyltransferase
MPLKRPESAANLARFTGLAEGYDRYRPHPPEALAPLLTQLAGGERPRLVADLGSGTGLSTRYWAGRADEAVGIEPNADMRGQAERARAGAGVRYREGLSSRTGLPDGCADIVTCSQALHWMDPEPTFAEAARLLRPGGIFAAYDQDWPPAVDWQAEEAFMTVMHRAKALDQERGIQAQVRWWPKSEHLERIRKSGRFRYVREVTLHSVETGNAERLVGLALSQGTVGGLLKAGLSEAEIGLDALREAAARRLGDEPRPWYFSYRVRLGVR